MNAQERRPMVATLVALGLTRQWLGSGSTPRVGDARVIAQGRFGLWAGWQALPEEAQRLACRFRLLARGTIEMDGSFRAQALKILTEGEEFQALAPLPTSEQERDAIDFLHFDVTAGGSLDRAIQGWMSELEGLWSTGRLNLDPPKRLKKSTVRHFVRGPVAFSVPKDHFPPQPAAWPPFPIAEQGQLSLDVPGLIAFAEGLDTAAVERRGEGFHREAQLNRSEVLRERLFGPMIDQDGPIAQKATPLSPGLMSLMLAPTGSGKSVFSQVAALKWASEGTGVAIVVPRVADVLKTTQQLERARELLDLSIDIVPLISPAGRFRALSRAWSRAGPQEGEGAWALERLGYHCPLRAYSPEDSLRIQRGKEPCNSLSPGTRVTATRVPCPFLSTCDLHRHERRAPSAQIIVVNHHNLLLGKTRTPMGVGGDLRRRGVMELVLARAQVVIIDEVDEFQKTMIGRDSGTLDLSSRGRLSVIHRIFRELEETAAKRDKGLRARDERGRRDLMMIQTLAQELTHLLSRADVSWPFHPRLRWSQSSDAFLCKSLFGGTRRPHLRRFDKLFQDDVPRVRLKAHETKLKDALRGWVDIRLDDQHDNGDRIRSIRDIIEGWPWPDGEPSPRVRASLTHLLIFRAALRGLEATLNRLRIRYPDLAYHDLPSVGDLREALEWHGLPTISPLGALGRQVYGFSRKQDHERGEGPLKGIALQGAPHEDVAAIGDTTALALIGQRRVVLGISATAWFPGSPLCDVKGRLSFVRPDPPDPVDPKVVMSTLKVERLGEDGQAFPVSISGVGEPTARQEACGHMGKALAPILCDALGKMEGDPAWQAQARALIATGSYLEAKALAQGLMAALRETEHPLAPELAAGLRLVPGPNREALGLPEVNLIERTEIESFAEKEGRILIAPLSIVARGHNILAPESDRSAIGAIYLAVRPVPPLDDASRVLAHVSAMAPTAPAKEDLLGALKAERKAAGGRFKYYLQQARPFTQLKEDLRHEILSDVLVELAQLAGRARRGDTSVQLFLIDGAFTAKAGGWPKYLRALLRHWETSNLYEEMLRNHGAFIHAIAKFCNFKPKRD